MLDHYLGDHACSFARAANEVENSGRETSLSERIDQQILRVRARLGRFKYNGVTAHDWSNEGSYSKYLKDLSVFESEVFGVHTHDGCIPWRNAQHNTARLFEDHSHCS